MPINTNIDNTDPNNINLDNLSPRESRRIQRLIDEKREAERMQQHNRTQFETIDPKEMLTVYANRIIGQDRELRKAVYLVYNYLRCYVYGLPCGQKNWFLTAPSGMGKTEFFRVTKNYLDEKHICLPIAHIDLSQLTAAGYKGNDIEDIVEQIEQTCILKMGGYAICFLDETDKKLIPDYGSNRLNFNAATQSNLLTFVEGITVGSFQTAKTMFVFMGAFQEVRNRKANRPHEASKIGFACTAPTAPTPTDGDFYGDITIQDMIDFGMVEEFAGRIGQVINFHRIARAEMKTLIASKIALIEEEMGTEIVAEPQAVRELMELSYGRLGIREPMNKLREIIIDLQSERLFDGDAHQTNDRIWIRSLSDYGIECGEYPKAADF